MQTHSETNQGNIYQALHVSAQQIWQISDFGWVFGCTISSLEHLTDLETVASLHSKAPVLDYLQ